MTTSLFTGEIFEDLKDTLDSIIMDPAVSSAPEMMSFCKSRPMTDNYHDDLEAFGPTVATEKPEGQEMGTGDWGTGYVTRYNSRTFALKLQISEEAMSDAKHKEIIDAVRGNTKAMWDTVEIDAALMLVNAWDTSYIGGDGQPLFSASHTLPNGGTFSNTLATPMTPSRLAVTVMTSAIKKLPGHNGVTLGYKPTKIVSPTEQWATWEGIVGSRYAPEPGAFNEINVVNQTLKLSAVQSRFWDNTTTNWMMLTDAPKGLQFRFRQRPQNRDWVENSQLVWVYGIFARWARGWSDPRGAYGSQA